MYLLLDSVYRVMASGDGGCNRLKWKAGSLEDVVCAGFSWSVPLYVTSDTLHRSTSTKYPGFE